MLSVVLESKLINNLKDDNDPTISVYFEKTVKCNYYSDEDENQVTKSKPDLKKSLVGNISNLYAEELKSNHNKSFRKLVSVYIYFNLYPYFFDLRYREEAKKVLNENQLFLFWLNLLYILPFSIGAKLMQSKNNNKKIRLYLKFIIRYIYT